MRLHGVGQRYGPAGRWVLRDVDLAVPPGTLLRVEGTNGSGKSTLLRLLAGVELPRAGRITGRPRTAYVPERFPAALPFTALGWLAHLGRVHGLRGRAARRAALECLERFGAAGYAGARLAELSKGTAQKVAVAQALLADPGLLVLDEAWTGLDRAAREELDRVVLERVAGGAAVVFVDHDPRRLAGAPGGSACRVAAGGAVSPPEPSAGAGPAVLIEAEGTGDPAGLPGVLAVEHGAGGVVRLTVAADRSDAVLRALLTARPPWHVRRVRPRDGGAPR
ncbi:ABC transporter ATP-binding protein [Streptomyces capparidis]